MDQLVKRPKAAAPTEIERVLGLGPSGRQKAGRRKWAYALAVLVVAGLGALGYAFFGSSEPQVSYATTPVERGDLTVEVTATGTLQPLTTVDVSSELSGVVRAVAVEENQHVNKGDVLATLDTAKLSAQVDSSKASVQAAQADVENAQATLSQAEQTFQRSDTLSKRGLVSAQDLDTAKTARDVAKIAVDSANAKLAIARANLKLNQIDLDNAVIYAPIDGVVLTRSVDPGQTVASSLSAPVLFVIAQDLKSMQLQAAIDEADVGSVAIGQKAHFTVDAYPDRSFQASISDISFASTTTDGVVTYNADLAVDNSDLALRPGMTATASIVTREARGVLLVPSSAFRFSPAQTASRRSFSLRDLFSPRIGRFGARDNGNGTAGEQGTRTLWVLRDGQPHRVQVKTGDTDGERSEILSGLSEGDQVITGTANPNAKAASARATTR